MTPPPSPAQPDLFGDLGRSNVALAEFKRLQQLRDRNDAIQLVTFDVNCSSALNGEWNALPNRHERTDRSCGSANSSNRGSHFNHSIRMNYHSARSREIDGISAADITDIADHREVREWLL